MYALFARRSGNKLLLSLRGQIWWSELNDLLANRLKIILAFGQVSKTSTLIARKGNYGTIFGHVYDAIMPRTDSRTNQAKKTPTRDTTSTTKLAKHIGR